MAESCFANGFALLIGVGRCAYTPWSLPVCSRDAETLKLTLTDPRSCGYLDEHIRLLTNESATHAGILAAMDGLGKAIADIPNSTVVVFYSGHGWLDEEGRYFLLPHDTDPSAFAATALGGDVFNEALRLMRPARLLVLLDTCHAGGMAEAKVAPAIGFPPGRKAPPESLAEALGSGRGRAVLSSCRGDETSLVLPEANLSLFTHHLIEALEGAGSRGESYVSVLDIGRYVGRIVARSAQKLGENQTPFFKAETEDFPVALSCVEQEVRTSDPRPMPPSPEPQSTVRVGTAIALNDNFIGSTGPVNKTSPIHDTLRKRT